MKMSLGEIVDRYSIVKLKSERTDLDCFDELNALKNEIDSVENLILYVQDLIDINGKIWDLESDIRKGKEGILGLEEVGRRAIAIRELNGIRVNLKNKINTFFNTGFIEKKINHASA
jgi:hypothetical protein